MRTQRQRLVSYCNRLVKPKSCRSVQSRRRRVFRTPISVSLKAARSSSLLRLSCYKLSELYEVAYNELLTLAGYPVPDDDMSERITPRVLLTAFGDITKEEEQELADYLDFLRARRGRKEQ